MLMIDETKLMMAFLESSLEQKNVIVERIKNDEVINTALEKIKKMTSDLSEEKQQIVFYEIANLSNAIQKICFDVAGNVMVNSITKAAKE